MFTKVRNQVSDIQVKTQDDSISAKEPTLIVTTVKKFDYTIFYLPNHGGKVHGLHQLMTLQLGWHLAWAYNRPSDCFVQCEWEVLEGIEASPHSAQHVPSKDVSRQWNRVQITSRCSKKNI